MRTPRAVIFVTLATLALSLTIDPAAQASITYVPLASFGAGEVIIPVGVAVDLASSSVYVGDTHGVNKYDPVGTHVVTFGGGFRSGVAVDPTNGNVYLINAEAQTIETYDSSGKEIAGENVGKPISVAGSANLFGFTIVQLASDSAGNVYLPNAPNNEVQEFDPSGSVLQTITGSGASALKEPTGVTVDSSGNIDVADTGNGRIEQFSPTGVFVRAISSPGVQAVTVDTAGDIFAGVLNEEDSCGSLPPPCYHVVVYDSAGSRLSDFGAGTIGTSAFGSINTLAVGSTGWVYVTDAGNNLVWIYAQPKQPSFASVLSPVVKQTSATLKATINPNYADTTYHFEYGTSTAYDSSVPVPDADIGNGISGPVVVVQELLGLAPGTTYHYRVVATNSAGKSLGVDQTFTTPPLQPPVVSTGQASGVAQNTATLSGTIDTREFETTYEFDLGADTSYGTRIFGDAGSAPGVQGFTVGMQGLAPASIYHYRIVATNIFGTTYGVDQIFTTGSYASSTLIAPAVPALVPAPAISSKTTASVASVKSVARSTRHARAKKSSRGSSGHRKNKSGSNRSAHAHGGYRRGK